MEFPQRVESALVEQSPESIASNNMVNDIPQLPDSEDLENQQGVDTLLATTAQEVVDKNNRDTGQVLEKAPLYNGSEQDNRKHAVISGDRTPQIMPLSGVSILPSRRCTSL